MGAKVVSTYSIEKFTTEVNEKIFMEKSSEQVVECLSKLKELFESNKTAYTEFRKVEDQIIKANKRENNVKIHSSEKRSRQFCRILCKLIKREKDDLYTKMLVLLLQIYSFLVMEKEFIHEYFKLAIEQLEHIFVNEDINFEFHQLFSNFITYFSGFRYCSI